ncbi:hypothetical protein DVH24_001967 [Malus domestica]|uniref:Uncharacterized protein n=1 Tax=Malus domestica TaxID=3750 RepID=A0A498I6D1_MALDO|nr:hypothetical protein DVH24_001967 [Malus domestica]
MPTTEKTIWLAGSVDVGVIEIVLEGVEEIGVGQLALAHDALAERLECVDVVDVHGHGGALIVHVAEEVFKSYGWAFPAIIASLLLSTGPKAFLMALALPLGQSAFSLLFEKLWGRTRSRPKHKSRTRRRRKPFASSFGNAKTDDKERYVEDQETSDRSMGYQSWVVGNDTSADDSGREASSLGGWDDLERMESARRQSRRKPMGKGKLSRRERNSDTPLLLRLLIAVFPFLGTWTKMFW